MLEETRERNKQKILEIVTPDLEGGEEVKAVYTGQTPIPPMTFMLIAPILFIFILKMKTIVATDRNLYVFPHKWMHGRPYSGAPYKVPIGQAKYASGSSYAQVDDGPKVWTMPFGPAKGILTELTGAVHDQQSGAQPAGQAGADAAASPAESQPEGASPAGPAGSS